MIGQQNESAQAVQSFHLRLPLLIGYKVVPLNSLCINFLRNKISEKWEVITQNKQLGPHVWSLQWSGRGGDDGEGVSKEAGRTKTSS